MTSSGVSWSEGFGTSIPAGGMASRKPAAFSSSSVLPTAALRPGLEVRPEFVAELIARGMAVKRAVEGGVDWHDDL